MEPKKFEYIDSLRGIAILLVLAIHNGQHGTSLVEVAPLFHKFEFAGHYGVQLFFIVSAYTLMLSHDSRKQENRPVKSFFIRRIFRIMPMYYIALLYYTIDSVFFSSCFSMQENVKEFVFSDAIRNLFFLNNFYPNMPYYVPGGWSVVAEMIFYLFLPVVWKYATSMDRTLLFFIASLFLSVTFSVLFADLFPSSTILYVSFPNQLPVFLLGILLFYIVKNQKITINKWIIGLLIITILLYIYFVPDENISDCLKAASILFVFAIIISKKQYKIIVNSFFSYTGKISFSMYIIHFGVLDWMSRLNFVNFISSTDKSLLITNYFIRYLVMFLITAVLSHFTYQYIEKYFIEKAKKIINSSVNRRIKQL